MKKIVRVNIPQNAAKLIVLALNILAKHLADGASSILNLLNMAELQRIKKKPIPDPSPREGRRKDLRTRINE